MDKISTYVEDTITEDTVVEDYTVVEEENNESAELDEKNSQLLEELSADSLGRWNRLISRTNWEKGEVIHRWRTQLRDAGFGNTFYSDETWAKRVGNVSPQHVGRLRRVFERFGEKSTTVYNALYWSHFQAALDWDDAEKWLGDANASQWSVATMRIQRWESLDEPMDLKPKDQDVVVSDLDEDVNPYNDSNMTLEGSATRLEPGEKRSRSDYDDQGIPFDPNDAEPFDADRSNREENGAKSKGKPGKPASDDDSSTMTSGEALARLGSFEDLPGDLREAFEQMKLAILNHKLSGWRDIEQQRVFSLLTAMRTVVFAKEDE